MTTFLMWLCATVCTALLTGWNLAEYIYGIDAPFWAMAPLTVGALGALWVLRRRGFQS